MVFRRLTGVLLLFESVPPALTHLPQWEFEPEFPACITIVTTLSEIELHRTVHVEHAYLQCRTQRKAALSVLRLTELSDSAESRVLSTEDIMYLMALWGILAFADD